MLVNFSSFSRFAHFPTLSLLMARRKKLAPGPVPPAATASHASPSASGADDDRSPSDDDLQQFVVKPAAAAPPAPTLKRKAPASDEPTPDSPESSESQPEEEEEEDGEDEEEEEDPQAANRPKSPTAAAPSAPTLKRKAPAAAAPPAPTLKRKAPPADEPTPDSPESSESQPEEEEEEDGEDEEDPQAANRPKSPTAAAPPAPTLKRKSPAAAAPPAPTLKRKAPPTDEPTPDSPESSESQPEEDEEEDGEDEEEEEDPQAANRPKSPTTVHVPVPESKPSGSKKPKVIDLSPPAKPTSGFKRVWSDDDEVVLLEALSAYRAEHGRLPLSKECDVIVARIAKLVKFSVTEKHVWNKIRTFKYNHDRRMMKRSKPNATNPHQLLVFKTSDELFRSSASKKNVPSKPKNNAPVATHDATTRTRVGETDEGDKAKPYFYLGELMKTATGPYIPTLDFVVQNVGDFKSHDLDTKAKKLWIDAIKLHSKEKRLFADLLDTVAIKMVGRKN